MAFGRLLGGRGIQRGLPLLFNRACSTTEGAVELVDLCVIDPRFVLEKKFMEAYKDDRQEGDSQPMVPFSAAPHWLENLARPEVQLADMDDPMSYTFFGKRGEIFEYTFIGTHATRSGYTSIIDARTLGALHRGEQDAPSFEDFVDWQRSGAGPDGAALFPFLLHAGRVIEARSASVFRLVKGEQLAGLVITSDYDSIDDF